MRVELGGGTLPMSEIWALIPTSAASLACQPWRDDNGLFPYSILSLSSTKPIKTTYKGKDI